MIACCFLLKYMPIREYKLFANLEDMTNLIPEKRMDRNGKLVTRHVRSSSGDTGSSGIPAPVVPVINRSEQSTAQLSTSLIRLLMSSREQADKTGRNRAKSDRMIGVFASLEAKSLKAMLDRAESLPEESRRKASHILISYPQELKYAEYYERDMHYFLELHPVISMFRDGSKTDQKISIEINTGMKSLFRGSRSDLLLADENEKQVAQGFAAAHCLLEDSYNTVHNVVQLSWMGEHLDDLKTYEEVIRKHGSLSKEYIMGLQRHPVDSVFNVVHTHGVTDLNTIDGILSGAPAPVAEGWL